VTGTDFGTQQGPFVSPQSYRDLYKPFHRAVNEWVHRNTTWKTFIHTCGSVRALLPDFIDAGFDILNPVQISAADMDPAELKRDFGDSITFWGGGIDTQRTLPFGSAEEVGRQVSETVSVLGTNGGFVFGSVHNIQAGTPTENLLALFEAFARERE
jgi:uroporphyrinogen-III decarboxylase